MTKDNMNTALIVIVVVLLALILFGGFGMMGIGNWGYGHMMSGFYGGFGTMWLFGWFFMILVIVALVLFIVWMVKQIQQPAGRGSKR
jgi:uncharacterized membrane protein